MMVFTHALLGALLAVPLLATAPDLAPVALVAGLAGGVVLGQSFSAVPG